MFASLVVAVILVVIGGLVWRALTTGSIEAPKKPERRKSSVSAALLLGDKPPSFYAAPESTRQVLEQVRKLSRATEELAPEAVSEPCEDPPAKQEEEPSKAAEQEFKVPEVLKEVKFQEPAQEQESPAESAVTAQESSDQSDDDVNLPEKSVHLPPDASVETPLQPQVPQEASTPAVTPVKQHVQFREPEVEQVSEEEEEDVEDDDEEEADAVKSEVKPEVGPGPVVISPNPKVPAPVQNGVEEGEEGSDEEEDEEDLDEYSTGHNVTKILTADTSRKIHLSPNQIAQGNLLNQELMAAMAKRRSQAPPEE